MSVTINIGGVTAAAEQAAKEHYDQGFRAGLEAAMRALRGIAVDQEPAPLAESVEAPSVSEPIDSDGSSEAAPVSGVRAPKGLLDEILEVVLITHPGMTQEEVEAEVTRMEPRIAAKSVYNKLRYYEKLGRKYRRKDARWYRIQDLPHDFPVSRPTSGLFNGERREGPV